MAAEGVRRKAFPKVGEKFRATKEELFQLPKEAERAAAVALFAKIG
jgi:hypothetical protein